MGAFEGVLVIILGILVGVFFFGVFLHKKKLTNDFENAQLKSKNTLDNARKEADLIIKNAIQEGKEESKKRRKTLEDESKNRKNEIGKLEQKIKHREQTLQSKLKALERRETRMEEKETRLALDEKKQLKVMAEYELAVERNQATLQKIANMSPEEAKKELMESLKEVAKKESLEKIKLIEQETKRIASQKAKEIISLAVQRLSSEHVNDSVISVVTLPNEEMKGRIIGREGRNIRALEQATGVDLIIDDTPEAVIISCFNPVRREIAKITLEKLIADGRIHPARIEETAKRVEQELETQIKEYGEQAAFEVGITDFHPEILRHLGRLRFRTIGMQSVLQHSIETAHICGMLASEISLNIKKAKRAGLLHDIGKAVNQEVEGHHSQIGGDICKKYGEHDDIVDAVKNHHSEELLHASALSAIVGAANALSVNRPAARKELLATYIKRLEDMEALVKEFDGVESVYVLQAGREVRTLVNPEALSDRDVSNLSDEIAMKIRKELTFPGQVRVTVLRESKHVEFAT